MLKRLLAVVAFFALMDWAHGQIPMDALGGPMCGMVDPVTKAQVAVSPVFTRVNVIVTDAIAQAVVTQAFVNPFPSASEVIYLFPLPDQGSVHGMRYQYRDSLYTAQIMERAKAEAKYDSIRQGGGQAALLLQDKPNIFQQRIANMGAGETAHVEIRLSLPLKYRDGVFELAFPTRIGPRYGDGTPAAPGSWNPPEDRDGPGFQFNVLIQSGVELTGISSPSHEVDIGELGIMKTALMERQVLGPEAMTTAGFNRGVMLKSLPTYPNRDFVLRMQRARTAHDFSVASFRDTRGVGYFHLNLFPDPALLAGKRADMELVLLVDVSGSQVGWPLQREKEIALEILSRLTPADDLTVLSFSDGVKYAFGSTTPVPASGANITVAESFVRSLAVEGGTQLLDAVNQCLAVPTRAGKQRYYIFLTDGFITNEAAILTAIREHPSKPTILTFGAGNNLNRFFLEECAKVGNGFATPLVEGDAAGPAVELAWSRLESPQLENLQVDYGGLEVSEEIYPVSRRLYAGLPFSVTGKYARAGTYVITLTADKDGRPFTLSRTLTLAGEETLSWSVPKLWAREKIGRLMLEQGVSETNKDAIIAVSVEHQVLSRYTAFLASQPQAVAQVPGGGGVTEVRKARFPRPGAGRFDLAVRDGLLHLEWEGEAMQVIRVLDLQGRVIFVHRPAAGRILSRWVWDGRDALGNPLPKGRYLVSVQTARGLKTRMLEWNPRR